MSTTTKASRSSDPVYIDKRKFRVNVPMLLALALVLVALGAIGYFVHGYQVNRNAKSLKEMAKAAYEEGETEKAMGYIRKFVTLMPKDTEGLELLGTWTEKQAVSRDSMMYAFNVLNKVLQVESDREDIRRLMIRLTVKMGQYKQAMDLLSEVKETVNGKVQPVCNASECTCGDDSELTYLLGICQEGRDQIDDAGRSYFDATMKIRQQRAKANADEESPEDAALADRELDVYKSLARLIQQHGDEMKRLAQIQQYFTPEGVTIDQDVPPDPEVVCDLVLAKMVEDVRPRHRALLVRAAFRQTRRGSPEQIDRELELAGKDLEAALAEVPENNRALLAAAELELARAAAARLTGGKDSPEKFKSHSQAARGYIERGQKLTPPDVRFLLMGARLEIEAGHFPEAEDQLRRGLELIASRRKEDKENGIKKSPAEVRSENELEMMLHLNLGSVHVSEAFIEANPEKRAAALKSAEQSIDRLRALKARSVLIEYLRARRLVAEGEWAAAAAKFEEIRSELAPFPDAVRTADLSLDDCYSRLSNPDERIRVLRRALKEDPFAGMYHLRLAEALIEAGKPDEALREHLSPMRSARGVPASIARLLIRRQLRLAPEDRRWAPVEEVVEKAAEDDPDSVAVSILRAELLFHEGKIDDAEAMLSKAQEEHAADVLPWTFQASIALQRTDQDPEARRERAAAILEKARQALGDKVELRLARANMVVRSPGKRASAIEALEALESGADAFSTDERRRLLLGLAREHDRIGNHKRAASILNDLSGDFPQNLEIQLALVEAALAPASSPATESPTIDTALLKQAEAQIRKIEGGKGPLSSYVSGLPLLERVKFMNKLKGADLTKDEKKQNDQDLETAAERFKEVTQSRPSLADAFRRLGEVEKERDNDEAAYRYFDEAYKRGDRSQQTLAFIIQHLVDTRKAREAQDLVRQLRVEASSVLIGDVARAAARASLKAKAGPEGAAEALRLMDRTVENSRDYQDKIFKAWLLTIEKGRAALRDPQVESLYREAIDLAPQHPRPWMALIQFLMAADRAGETVAVLEDARNRVPEKPPHLRDYVLASCFMVLGDRQQTEAALLRAVAANPQLIPLHNALITFYVRDGQHAKAKKEVEKLIDDKSLKADAATVEAAKRTLAVIVSNEGDYRGLITGLELLEGIKPKAGDIVEQQANLRAQATILARSQFRDHRRKLIQVLNEMDRFQALTPADELQLARLYESDRRWNDARVIYARLLEADATNPALLAELVLGTLTHQNADEATVKEMETYVKKLERREPTGFRTAVCKARLLFAQDKPAEAVATYNAFLDNLQTTRPEELFRDLVKQQKADEAVQALVQMVKRRDDKAAKEILAHVQKLLNGGDDKEALEVLQRYVAASDMVEAIQLEFVRIVAGLVEGMKQFDDAEKIFRRFVDRAGPNRPDAELALAAFLARRGKIDDALDVCEHAATTCPPPIVARVGVGVLRAGTVNPAQILRVEDRLLAALTVAETALKGAETRYQDAEAAQKDAAKNKGKNDTADADLKKAEAELRGADSDRRKFAAFVESLTLSLADLRDFQGRYEDAIKIYQHMLAKNDRNLVALNNLAWLLSFQPIGDVQKSSLPLINRAIELRGPAAELLDTRAIIFMNLNRPADAVEDLTRATLEVETPAILFHLAQAQSQAGEKARAIESYRKAESAGFDAKSLHVFEQNAHGKLMKTLGLTGDRTSAGK